jgi:hypothetical protein
MGLPQPFMNSIALSLQEYRHKSLTIWGNYTNTIGEKIEKLKYNVGYKKIGDDFFIGGA